MKELYEYDEEYRDSIATVDAQGKRVWIYPKKPKGKFFNARKIVSVILLTILFAGPFIKINGQPFLMMNIFERKFVILGTVFWPQDFFIFALGLITFFVFIILFTVVFGRVWCGWACPQTLFMEMVFRRIEYWIEGDANQQRKLAKMPWNGEKIRKRLLKHSIFVVIAVLIGHTAMAYLIGIEKVQEIVSQPPSENLAVMYDWIRGEPRGKMKKSEVQADKGDCIDCKLCVHVCPTGIDIRNGTQLECVNCTACIDVCDDVMTKIDKPTGLIRIASHSAIADGKKRIFTPRVAGYTGVLVALIVLLTIFVSSRSDIQATILRTPGMLYQKVENDQIQNVYSIQLINKTIDDMNVHLRLIDHESGVIEVVGGNEIKLLSSGKADAVFTVRLPESEMEGNKNSITVGIFQGDDLIDKVKTNFLGPIKFK